VTSWAPPFDPYPDRNGPTFGMSFTRDQAEKLFRLNLNKKLIRLNNTILFVQLENIKNFSYIFSLTIHLVFPRFLQLVFHQYYFDQLLAILPLQQLLFLFVIQLILNRHFYNRISQP